MKSVSTTEQIKADMEKLVNLKLQSKLVKITVRSMHVLKLGVIIPLVNNPISLDMNQFVEGHQITQ